MEEEPSMIAKIDEDRCIRCAMCTQTCPQVFAMKGNKAIVRKNFVPCELEDRMRRAWDECPMNAIEDIG